MKPQTYFRLALLFPYILWGVGTLLISLLSSQEINILLAPITFYVIGVIFWLIPYTLLAVSMWFWSKNKSIVELRKAGILAPVLLLVPMLIETVLILLPADSAKALITSAIGASAFMGGLSLVYGYICVGIAMGIFKLLQMKNIILEETPALPLVTP